MPVRIYAPENTHIVDLFSVPMLVGAVLMPAGMLLRGVVLGVFLSEVLRRNLPVRAAFNVANQTGAVALSLLVLRALAGTAAPITPRGWAALVAALLTYETYSNLWILAVLSVNGSPPDANHIRDLAKQLWTLVPLCATLAILAVETYWTEPWALLVLAGPGLIAARWQVAAVRLRQRYADQRSLYSFTVRLADLSEHADVLSVALSEVASILHCERVQLCMEQTTGASRYWLDEKGALVRSPGAFQPLEQLVVSNRQTVLLRRSHDHEYLRTQGFSDAMLVPLVTAEDHHGILIAADRHGNETVTFEPEDLPLLEALAAHLATALTSCARLDRLRVEVAAREHQAYHDGLTGLANRTLFNQVVSAAIKNRKGSRLVAVMIMDLDGFKEINDTLGHHAGDAILKAVAERVNAAVGKSRLAARLGGDEFAFVIPAASGTDQISSVASAVQAAVSAPIEIDGMVLTLRASMGVALAPLHGDDPTDLLKRADVAMYSAKSSGRGIVVYDPKIDHNSTRRLVLASELQRAVEHGGLELWYQPIAAISSNRITGFEALLRWRHPELGFVPPDEFIPVAEQTGLIEPVTWWVIRTALEELRRWRDDGYELTMGVNVSARSLFDSTMVDRLRRLILDIGVNPAHLTVEITESSMMLDLDRSERTLRRLNELGVRIAIDDFGTGYSSLSRLKVLPVKTVKIDRSFVRNLCSDQGDRAIVRSTIELARVMGLTVVAEGVEDQETWEELGHFGCESAQGWYLAKAMDADLCHTWLTDRQAPTLAPLRRLAPWAGDGIGA